MRAMSDALLSELTQSTVRPFFAVEIEFADATLRLWTGIGTLSWIRADFNCPTITSIVGTGMPSGLTAGIWYAHAVRLEEDGSLGLVSTESSFTVANNHRQKMILNAFEYPFGIRIYVGTAAGQPTKYCDWTNADIVAGSGSIVLDMGSYTDGVLDPTAFLGIGTLGGISPITETADLQINGVQLSLSGIPSDLLGEALTECRQGLPCRIYFGMLTSSGVIIADPVRAFSGRMDTVAIDEGAATSTITVTVESRARDFMRARIRRYTDDDQQRTNPGDKGFQYVPMVQDWNGSWGLHDRGH